MAKEDVPVDQISDLYKSIKACRESLLEQEGAMLHVMRGADHPAVYEFRHILSEMRQLAIAIEGRGRLTHGDEAWEQAVSGDVGVC